MKRLSVAFVRLAFFLGTLLIIGFAAPHTVRGDQIINDEQFPQGIVFLDGHRFDAPRLTERESTLTINGVVIDRVTAIPSAQLQLSAEDLLTRTINRSDSLFCLTDPSIEMRLAFLVYCYANETTLVDRVTVENGSLVVYYARHRPSKTHIDLTDWSLPRPAARHPLDSRFATLAETLRGGGVVVISRSTGRKLEYAAFRRGAVLQVIQAIKDKKPQPRSELRRIGLDDLLTLGDEFKHPTKLPEVKE